MVTTREQGQLIESLACTFLEKKGLILKERNYHSRFGEVDLIMLHDDSLVFVEVRYRKNTLYGSGADTVTAIKHAKLIKTASAYLQQHDKLNKYPARFDVISISGSLNSTNTDKMDIVWIENAFGI